MGVWQALPNMPIARANHSATLLQDGRVLIAGGINAAGVQCKALIYDPNYTGGGAPWYTDTDIGGGTCAKVQGHAAVQLKNGRVLLAGGNDPFGEVNNSYIYVPAQTPSPDNAAATPPCAQRVVARSSSAFDTTPTVRPSWLAARTAADRPATPLPMTATW